MAAGASAAGLCPLAVSHSQRIRTAYTGKERQASKKELQGGWRHGERKHVGRCKDAAAPGYAPCAGSFNSSNANVAAGIILYFASRIVIFSRGSVAAFAPQQHVGLEHPL